MSHSKLSLFLICSILALARYVPAQNLVQNPGFENTSTDPNLVCANWTRTVANSGTVTEVTREATGGVSGASLHFSTGSAAIGANVATNGAWQIVGPLVVGAKYQIGGKWRGKMALGTVTGAQGAVEVYYGFGSSPTLRASSGAEKSLFSKREQNASTNRWNVDPNSSWGWTELSASPTMGQDAGNTVTATDTYMTIRIAMNTTVLQGGENMDVDNISVQGCQASIGAADVNGDCNVNFKDMSAVANNWLACGITSSAVCW
jgi:hypothetical protein